MKKHLGLLYLCVALCVPEIVPAVSMAEGVILLAANSKKGNVKKGAVDTSSTEDFEDDSSSGAAAGQAGDAPAGTVQSESSGEGVPTAAGEEKSIGEKLAEDQGQGEGGLRRSGRMEFDERLIKGQAAKSGAVYLFKRVPRRLPGLVPMRRSYRRRIVEPVLGIRELAPAMYSYEAERKIKEKEEAKENQLLVKVPKPEEEKKEEDTGAEETSVEKAVDEEVKKKEKNGKKDKKRKRDKRKRRKNKKKQEQTAE